MDRRQSRHHHYSGPTRQAVGQAKGPRQMRRLVRDAHRARLTDRLSAKGAPQTALHDAHKVRSAHHHPA